MFESEHDHHHHQNLKTWPNNNKTNFTFEKEVKEKREIRENKLKNEERKSEHYIIENHNE